MIHSSIHQWQQEAKSMHIWQHSSRQFVISGIFVAHTISLTTNGRWNCIAVRHMNNDFMSRIQCPVLLNTLRPRQNGGHFTDDICKCIFLNEKVFILIWNSLKYIPQGPYDNKWTLIQVMAWRPIGDKPLPEPMLTQFTDAYMRH